MQLGNPILSGAIDWSEEEFTPSLGQVTFILSNVPEDPVSLELKVNGVAADSGVEYSISGVTITWLNVNFSLGTADLVTVRYQ